MKNKKGNSIARITMIIIMIILILIVAIIISASMSGRSLKEYISQKMPIKSSNNDMFDTFEEAEERALELGCTGHHPYGDKYYMPCETHEEYLSLT